MCEDKFVKEVLARGCEGADIAISEGVMGMFDGKDPLSNKGSSAEIAIITDKHVFLVINGSGMARSAAAVVKGFETLTDDVKIAGGVANRVGSEGQFELIKQAMEQEYGVFVVGYLKNDPNITLPERYAGLVPLLKNKENDPTFDTLATSVQSCFDLESLYEAMGKEAAPERTDTLFGFAKDKRREKLVYCSVE